MPTDKEISDLAEIILQRKNTHNDERIILRQADAGITSIKMMPRVVEDIPAVPAVPAVMDGDIEITPAIPAKPAVMKTVFDVMPTDPMIASKKMNAARRQEIFDATNLLINPV